MSCRCQLLCFVGPRELQTCGSQSPDPCRQEAQTQVSCNSSLQPAHKKRRKKKHGELFLCPTHLQTDQVELTNVLGHIT